MNTHWKVFLFVGVLVLTASAAAGATEFKDGLIHDIDYLIEDDVWVDYQAPGMETTINWLEGAILPKVGGVPATGYKLAGFEDSSINILGGEILWRLQAYGRTQVSMSGGFVNILLPEESSQVDISGGLISDLLCGGSSQGSFSGGQIGNCISFGGSSQGDISGGLMATLFAENSGQVSLSGGQITTDLWAIDGSRVDMSGGSVGQKLISEHSGILAITGQDFEVDGEPFGYGQLTSKVGGYWHQEPLRHLTGTLASGEPIDNYFGIGHDAKIVLIPEPATMSLLALGGLALLRRQEVASVSKPIARAGAA